MASALPTTAPVAAAPPDVEGSIDAPPSAGPSTASISSHSGQLQTLDEPVLTTVLRDLKRVGTKLKHVLLPVGTQSDTIKELRDWDLWGPLLLCLVLSIVLSLSAPTGQSSLVFASVFFIVWAGAAVVTLNAKLLGGNISFFQSVCVLGYCIFPLVVACVLCFAWSNGLWRLAVAATGLVWSTRASVIFMSELVPEPKRTLAVYPVGLFYILIAWMIYIQ